MKIIQWLNEQARALNGALALLTTLPTLPVYPAQPGAVYAYFPLVGLLLGGLLWTVNTLAGMWFPAAVQALAVLLAWVLLTGGLHLDGFGDACDGLFATVDPAHRLEIMKDPRTGSWAVIGLGLLLLGKWAALQTVPAGGLVLAPVLARWVMVLAAVGFPYARREGGMGGTFREGLGGGQVLAASLTAFVVVGVYWRFALHAVAVLALVGLAARWASRRLGGGLTGDLYGALGELTEAGLLLALTAGINSL